MKFVYFLFIFLTVNTYGFLEVSISNQESVGNKGLVEMEVSNKFDQGVKGARAWVFLMDDEGKVVGNKAQWIIGGEKDKPGLEKEKQQKYSVVVDTQKPFTKAKLTFSKLILEDGTSVDPRKNIKAPKK